MISRLVASQSDDDETNRFSNSRISTSLIVCKLVAMLKCNNSHQNRVNSWPLHECKVNSVYMTVNDYLCTCIKYWIWFSYTVTIGTDVDWNRHVSSTRDYLADGFRAADIILLLFNKEFVRYLPRSSRHKRLPFLWWGCSGVFGPRHILEKSRRVNANTNVIFSNVRADFTNKVNLFFIFSVYETVD